MGVLKDAVNTLYHDIREQINTIIDRHQHLLALPHSGEPNNSPTPYQNGFDALGDFARVHSELYNVIKTLKAWDDNRDTIWRGPAADIFTQFIAVPLRNWTNDLMVMIGPDDRTG